MWALVLSSMVSWTVYSVGEVVAGYVAQETVYDTRAIFPIQPNTVSSNTCG